MNISNEGNKNSDLPIFMKILDMDSEHPSEVCIKETDQHNRKVLVYQMVDVKEKFDIKIFNYNSIMCSVDIPRNTVEVYFVLSSPFLKIKTIDYKIGVHMYYPKLPYFLFKI